MRDTAANTAIGADWSPAGADVGSILSEVAVFGLLVPTQPRGQLVRHREWVSCVVGAGVGVVAVGCSDGLNGHQCQS